MFSQKNAGVRQDKVDSCSSFISSISASFKFAQTLPANGCVNIFTDVLLASWLNISFTPLVFPHAWYLLLSGELGEKTFTFFIQNKHLPIQDLYTRLDVYLHSAHEVSKMSGSQHSALSPLVTSATNCLIESPMQSKIVKICSVLMFVLRLQCIANHQAC